MATWPRPYRAPVPQRTTGIVAARRTGSVCSFRCAPARGVHTTVHLALHPAQSTRVAVELLRGPTPLASWCEQTGVRHAIVGGFFVRQGDGTPLGEVWLRGLRVPSVPFDAPWAATRSCVAIDDGHVVLAARDQLPAQPRGDLLQAGPLLVADGAPVVRPGVDPEGFSAGRRQFDSDITAGRYPRAALGVNNDWILAVACDGRSAHDTGLALCELAELMAALGADRAINLDGGGSTSLDHDGELRNTPREEHGIELLIGRPVATALVFEPRG